MLLESARAHLIVVDVQERLMPAIHDGPKVVGQTKMLLAGAARLGIPVTVTEQYPKGLGRTVPDLREALPNDAAVLEKISFSGAADAAIARRVEAERSAGRDQLVICGAEAHVCVLQTALGFKAAGLTVAVAGDATSSRVPRSASTAEARLLQAGCLWVTTEMVLFEWLAQAGTDAFRALAPLIRDGAPA